MAKLITRQVVADEAVEKYFAEQDREHAWGHKRDAKYAILKRMSEPRDPEKVAKIIDLFFGMCSECKCEDPDGGVVQVGEEPWWGSATITLCKDCVIKALNTFTK